MCFLARNGQYIFPEETHIKLNITNIKNKFKCTVCYTQMFEGQRKKVAITD